MSHNRSTMAQKEYVKAIVHNLSLQRFNDTEIVDFLAEKGIVLKRNTVNGIKKQIEKQAERWYIDLKQSRYKYIATYKERLDSLLSYQKKLHDIISTTKKDEVKIRAISELHSIEMEVFNLWKQLPQLDIVSRQEQEQQLEEQEKEEEPPLLSIEDLNGVDELPNEVKGLWHDYHQCSGCNRWWSSKMLLDYHKKRTECGGGSAAATVVVGVETAAAGDSSIPESQEDKTNKEEWQQLQCPACKKWFMNNFRLSTHQCT